MSTLRISDRIERLERQVAHLEAKLPVPAEAEFHPRQQAPRLSELLEMTAQAFGTSVAALRGAVRAQPVPQARHAFAWVARQVTGASLRQIGDALGDRDHTTIVHGTRQARALRAASPRFLALTDELLRQARGRA